MEIIIPVPALQMQHDPFTINGGQVYMKLTLCRCYFSWKSHQRVKNRERKKGLDKVASNFGLFLFLEGSCHSQTFQFLSCHRRSSTFKGKKCHLSQPNHFLSMQSPFRKFILYSKTCPRSIDDCKSMGSNPDSDE